MKKNKKANAAGMDTSLAAQAQTALSQTPPPSVDDINVLEAVEQENTKAKKRKGRAKTMLGGAYEMPMTEKTVLDGRY